MRQSPPVRDVVGPVVARNRDRLEKLRHDGHAVYAGTLRICRLSLTRRAISNRQKSYRGTDRRRYALIMAIDAMERNDRRPRPRKMVVLG
jgi:hypothetical protein